MAPLSSGGSLTLMSLDRQLETLSALYAEKSDAELLGLNEQRDGLTELAQEALADAMRQRGLSARGVVREQAASGDAGGEDKDSLEENEMLAYLFHDAFEAREAIRTMTEAGIEHRILDWHRVEPEREVSYTGVDLGLVVQRQDAKQTMTVLKEKLGLFPSPEVAAEGGSNLEDALVVLSMFDRAEALVAARSLGEAGISYLWRDGRDEASMLPDEETVSIEVKPAEMERATKLVEDALGEAH